MRNKRSQREEIRNWLMLELGKNSRRFDTLMKNLKKCTIEQNNFLKRVDKDLESGYYQIKITPKKKQKKRFLFMYRRLR